MLNQTKKAHKRQVGYNLGVQLHANFCGLPHILQPALTNSLAFSTSTRSLCAPFTQMSQTVQPLLFPCPASMPLGIPHCCQTLTLLPKRSHSPPNAHAAAKTLTLLPKRSRSRCSQNAHTALSFHTTLRLRVALQTASPLLLLCLAKVETLAASELLSEYHGSL